MRSFFIALVIAALVLGALLVVRERAALRHDVAGLRQTVFDLAQQVNALNDRLTVQSVDNEEARAHLEDTRTEITALLDTARAQVQAAALRAPVPSGAVVAPAAAAQTSRAEVAAVAVTNDVTAPRAGGPAYTSDLTIWPNAVSRANSDAWIVENHDRIRRMEPRLLVINFTRGAPSGQLRDQIQQLISALRKSTQYHGYRNTSAPAFLEYKLFKMVNSRDIPLKSGTRTFDYGALFGARYARLWGVADPDNPARFLRLDELVARGYVHEVVFFFSPADDYHCFECVEMKPCYDELFKRSSNAWRQAGNGGDNDQPWIGRSLRINALNAERGIGCGTENLGHSLEGMANCGAIPYFTRYFKEYAMLDLDTRYGLPFTSLYALPIKPLQVAYPTRTTAVITWHGEEYRVTNYIPAGGNVHFPPNARGHYDQENDQPVASTIEDWRCGSGPGGADRVVNYSRRMIARYRKDAPDCMGTWLIYWRQNMPGLDNGAMDDAGRPMKNWWPFLFY